MKVFLVCSDPVCGDIVLRCGQIDLTRTDQLVEMFLESILHVCIPHRGGVGLRPEIVDVFHTALSGSNQVIDLIVVGASVDDSVLLKDLLSHGNWNHAGLPEQHPREP